MFPLIKIDKEESDHIWRDENYDPKIFKDYGVIIPKDNS
jgi:hypothetical protein